MIFDLDDTVINSRDRSPLDSSGSLDLQAYIALHTPANVAKDTLLPLAKYMRQCYEQGDYVIILTARDMKACDHLFLMKHRLFAHKIFSRDQASETHYNMRDGEYKYHWINGFLKLKQFSKMPVIMFDDSKAVKTKLRALFPVLCAHKINARLV